MTAQQEGKITHMRLMGESCGRIAQSLNIPVNTVKSFCRRRNLSGKKIEEQIGCAYCGTAVQQTKHRKLKKFCSDTCRMKWWNEHRNLINRKSKVRYQCMHCGKEFSDYEAAARKYCSHECYIADRFGDGQRAVPQ